MQYLGFGFFPADFWQPEKYRVDFLSGNNLYRSHVEQPLTLRQFAASVSVLPSFFEIPADDLRQWLCTFSMSWGVQAAHMYECAIRS